MSRTELSRSIEDEPLLKRIDAYLTENPMGETYFGKRAASYPSLLERLRAGKPVGMEIRYRVRDFLDAEDQKADAEADAST